MRNIFKFFLSLVICQAAGIVGSLFTVPAIDSWYSSLNKPEFTPPGEVIGAIWTVLFLLMGGSLYLVWAKNWEIRMSFRNRIGRLWKIGARKSWNRFSEKLWLGNWKKANSIIIFCLQLALNILWSVIFFGLKMPGLAFFELLMLWTAIAYTIINFYRISKPASYLLVPYIIWVAFAGYLNFSIWMMN